MPTQHRTSRRDQRTGHEYSHRRVIASHSRECQRVLNEIRQILEALEFEEHDIFSVHTATDEALANAVKHGNGCSSDRQIEIECIATRQVVRIRITDEGRGFDPARVLDPRLPEYIDRPHGRGLLMMRHFMNEVRFTNGGRTVEMWKQSAHTYSESAEKRDSAKANL